jgi:hypothetical protein
MNAFESLSHAWLACEGPLGLGGGGADFPQPDTRKNIAPDNAAPLARDFHMATPSSYWLV